MLEANTFPKDGAARGREYRNSQYTYRDRWTKVTARVLWNGLREQGSVLGYQNIRPNNGAKYVARWNLWYERKELSLPSSLLFLLPLSPSNAVEQNFSVFLSFSLSPPLSLVRNLGSLHATIVTSSSSTSINSSFSPSPLPRSKREKSRCLSSALYPCRARVSDDQRGRSSELFTLSRGIISVKMWTVSREEEWSFHGRDFCIRHRGRGRGEDIRTKTKFWGVYLTCFREYVMNRSVVDSSIIVEIFFFFFRWY